MNAEGISSWSELRGKFYILPASALSRMQAFDHFQALNERKEWLGAENPPITLLFVSHRWDSLLHPDPTARQKRALQALLDQIPSVVRALVAQREQRLEMVPDLAAEGTLQAEEIARRILGFGPFSKDNLVADNDSTRKHIVQKAQTLDADSFSIWLLDRIGVWVDYCCVPQSPRSEHEQLIFEETLENLDQLLSWSIVLSLRSKGDDYAERTWCISEAFLGGKRSFSRSLHMDINRVHENLPVLVPIAPSSSDSAITGILQGGYDDDLHAFQQALSRWSEDDLPLIHMPPDAWSAYRSLQGSAMISADNDPNPARHAVEFIRTVSIELIRRWWMSETTVTIDLVAELKSMITRQRLNTADPTDQIYLGLLLAKNGWIVELVPFFSECLNRFLGNHNSLNIELQPTSQAFRDTLKSIRPGSAEVWFSRLSQQSGHSAEEKTAIETLRGELNSTPLEWRYI